MRVLIDYRPALRDRTGVGEWVHSLVSALSGSGLDDPPVELTVFSSSWRERLAPVPGAARTVDSRIPARLLESCCRRLDWPPVEWLAGASYDVVHSPHPLLIPTRSTAQVVSIHDLDFLGDSSPTDAEIARDYAVLVRCDAQRARQVIVPSRFLAAEVEERLAVPPERITVCYNAVPDCPSPRNAWPDRGHILFVGSLAPRKNIGQLLDAYRQLLAQQAAERAETDSVPPLVLVGPPTSHAADWLTAIEQPPLRDRVHYTGYVSRDQLKALYEGASMLVLPSSHEGFGLPVLEAMTIGVPVIISDRGALPEVSGDGGLVVDPLEPSSLAEAIRQMLTDEPFARACAERGFQRAARFSWRESARSLRTAYARAAA